MFQLQSIWLRYGVAALGTLIASLLYLLVGSPAVDSDLRYFGFILVVLFSAIFGGQGPGLFATALAAFASVYLLLPPVFSVEAASETGISRLILFVGEGVLLSVIGHTIRKAHTSDVPVSRVRRYLPVLLLVSAATGLKLIAWGDVTNASPFSLYYFVTSTSAWLGGFGPGLASALLSSLSARYFFLDPPHSLSVISRVEAARCSIFVAEGILLSYLSSRDSAARRMVNETVAQLRSQGHRLWKSIESTRALKAISRDIIWEWDLVPGVPKVRPAGLPEPRESKSLNLADWLDQIHPKDRLKVLESLRSAIDEGRREWSYEYRKLRPQGDYVHVADHAYVIRDEAWKPIRVVGRSAEVPDVHEFGTEGYRALFENSPRATLLVDKKMRIVEANEAAADLFGYSPAEVAKLLINALFEEPKRNAVMKKLLQLDPEYHSSVTFEEECMRADREVFRARINASLVAVKGTSVDHMIIIEELGDSESN
jgi:PAS domain S-box-containing protein